MRARAARRRPSSIHPSIAAGWAPALRHSPGSLAGERLIQSILRRALEDPGHLGEQVGNNVPAAVTVGMTHESVLDWRRGRVFVGPRLVRTGGATFLPSLICNVALGQVFLCANQEPA